MSVPHNQVVTSVASTMRSCKALLIDPPAAANRAGSRPDIGSRSRIACQQLRHLGGPVVFHCPDKRALPALNRGRDPPGRLGRNTQFVRQPAAIVLGRWQVDVVSGTRQQPYRGVGCSRSEAAADRIGIQENTSKRLAFGARLASRVEFATLARKSKSRQPELSARGTGRRNVVDGACSCRYRVPSRRLARDPGQSKPHGLIESLSAGPVTETATAARPIKRPKHLFGEVRVEIGFGR
jgi:hypothetical protein